MKVYYVENHLYRIKSDRIFKIYNAIALFFSKKSISLQPLLKNDLVAQLVEHIPFKDGVLGSNPSWITKKNRIIERLGGFLFFKVYNFTTCKVKLIFLNDSISLF